MNIGPMNEHGVGRILKETVRRAVSTIRNERMAFEVKAKVGYSGNMDDVLTSADEAAQKIYLRAIKECFPDCGIIAEEDGVAIEPKNGGDAYFTVDPLDGTKAFTRGQSHGIGTMIALIKNGEAISAYVGDINTEETYGYRPDSSRVHRITRLDNVEEMAFSRPFKEGNKYAILRDPVKKYSLETQRLVEQSFESHLVDGGSIGIWLARLWKREVSAALLPPGWETPWDSSPIIGISQRLGYFFFRPTKNGWEEYIPVHVKEKERRDHDTLIIHREDVNDVLQSLL